MYAPEATSNTTCLFGILLGSQKANCKCKTQILCLVREKKHGLQKILPSKRDFGKKHGKKIDFQTDPLVPYFL